MVTTKPITIYLTEKDLREAEPGKPSKCIVARALKRAFLREHNIPKGAYLDVTVIAALVVQVLQDGKQAQVHWWNASKALQDRIIAFDRGEPVKPGTFRLTPGKVPNR